MECLVKSLCSGEPRFARAARRWMVVLAGLAATGAIGQNSRIEDPPAREPAAGSAPTAAPPVVSTGQRSLDLLLRAQLPVGAASGVAAPAPSAFASAPIVPATPATVQAQDPTLRESLQREAAEFAAAQKQAEANPDGEPLPLPARDAQAQTAQEADDAALRAAVDRLGLRSVLWWVRENRDWIITVIVLGAAAGLAVAAWRRSRGTLADLRRRRRQERRRHERTLAEQAAAPGRGHRGDAEPLRPRESQSDAGVSRRHGSDRGRRRSHRGEFTLRPRRASR